MASKPKGEEDLTDFLSKVDQIGMFDESFDILSDILLRIFIYYAKLVEINRLSCLKRTKNTKHVQKC